MPAPKLAGKSAPPEPALYTINWLSATGTGILVSAVLSGLMMGISVVKMARIYFKTLIQVRFSLITIAAMLALGYMTKYSGTDATLGLALARTGKLYPFFGTLLGWLGVALTGSDTASNVLFGSLQNHCESNRHFSDADVRREQLGRCDGQNGGRTKHRGRQHRHELVRP